MKIWLYGMKKFFGGVAELAFERVIYAIGKEDREVSSLPILPKAAGGKQLIRMKFSPDGQMLAVPTLTGM